MEGFVATKLDEFQQGKISRRTLIRSLTMAATSTAAATSEAHAAEAHPVQVALVNHISYTSSNFRQAADWYSRVFSLDQIGLTDTEIRLPFGKKGEKPFGVTANDVPPTFLRCRAPEAAPPSSGQHVRPPQALIDHLGFTVADWDRERVRAALTKLGVRGVRDGTPYSLHMLDPFDFDIEIVGLEGNALTIG